MFSISFFLTEKAYYYIIHSGLNIRSLTMKKAVSLFLCAILIFQLSLCANAFEIKYYAAAASEISDTVFSESENGGDFTVSYISSRKGIEDIRAQFYRIALESYGTREKLEASNDAYLCQQTSNYCEISLDGENWFLMKKIPDASFTFSLFGDVLPLLDSNSVNLTPLSEGFDFQIRILTASENYAQENAKTVFTYVEGPPVTLSAPAFRFVIVSLPSDAVFSQNLPLFFSDTLPEDIILSAPERNGYIFDGWSITDDAKRVDRIPKDAVAVYLTSHWIAKEYEINYNLTTNIEYNFGRIDNSANPTFYTVGTTQPVYNIRPPVAGYVFDGWYYTADFSGERVCEISAGETGDKILYAKWLSFEDIEREKRETREKFMADNMYGDPDGDGKITAADARLVLRTCVGLETHAYEILKRVDYYNTNTISSANARITLRISVGLDDLYTVLLEHKVFPV